MNAGYDVVLFNALKIYYFRTVILDPSIETPSEVQTALKTVLCIIERTFVSGRDEYHDRLDSPLFLAGIETGDRIYKGWILSRISISARTALQQAMDIQSLSESRLGMCEIRALLSGRINGDLAMETGQRTFLELITES